MNKINTDINSDKTEHMTNLEKINETVIEGSSKSITPNAKRNGLILKEDGRMKEMEKTEFVPR